MRRASYIFFLAACGTPPAPPHTPGVQEGFAWDYEVRVEWGEQPILHASAVFRDASARLRIDDDAEDFVEGLERIDGTKIALGDRCAAPCRVRWRVDLGRLAHVRKDVDVALDAGGAIFSPPSSWLVRPATAPEGARYRLHVTTTPPIRFVTRTLEAPAASLDDPPFAAFGELDVRHVGSLDAVIAPRLALSHDLVATWLEKEAGAIGAYLEHAPKGVVFFAPGTQDVTRGKTFRTSVLIRVGTSITPKNLLDDWVLAHELLHLSLPGAPQEHAWFNEGLATYVEPIARARAGLVTPEKVWTDFAEGLPRGRGTGSLVGATDFDRIYWGGAALFLAADVLARHENRALDDCMRKAAASADGETTWPIERWLDLCGMKDVSAIDDAKMMSSLGVVRDGKTVRFDDRATNARIRIAITRPR